MNAAQQVTPLVRQAAEMVLDAGFRDVRNQGVLLRGVNTSPNELLDLCFTLLDHGKILPYYFYMCDMIPNAEHWRTSLAETQALQYGLLGYMPGFATPRIVCDVPFVGKRWVHMIEDYDRTRGISTGRRTTGPASSSTTPRRSTRGYHYYDPIYTLPEEGQEWWRAKMRDGLDGLLAELADEQGSRSAPDRRYPLPLVGAFGSYSPSNGEVDSAIAASQSRRPASARRASAVA